ncbi:uncharacterized protein METZ01_LOCUS104394, partial [marine metagenome]
VLFVRKVINAKKAVFEHLLIVEENPHLV